jgi:hypothetical protein
MASTTISGDEGQAIAKMFANELSSEEREYDYKSGGKSGEEDFIKALQEEGILDKDITYSTDLKSVKKYISRATGISMEELDKKNTKELEAMMSNYLDIHEANNKMKEFANSDWMPQVEGLEDAVYTALLNPKNLTKSQLNLLNEYWDQIDERFVNRVAGGTSIE